MTTVRTAQKRNRIQILIYYIKKVKHELVVISDKYNMYHFAPIVIAKADASGRTAAVHMILLKGFSSQRTSLLTAHT